MLRGFMGIANLEVMEAKLDEGKFLRMQSQLSALKVIRDSAAHTHLKGITTSLEAPSATLNRFNHIYEGLDDIDRKLKAYKPFNFV